MTSGQKLLDELECLEQSLEEILQSALPQKQFSELKQKESNRLQAQHEAVPGMISPEPCGVDLEMVRHFIREAGIEDALIKSLTFLLSKCIKTKGEVYAAPLNPSQTLLELSTLIDSNFCDDCIVHEIPKALARYGKVVKKSYLKLMVVDRRMSMPSSWEWSMRCMEMHLLISIKVWKFLAAFRIQELKTKCKTSFWPVKIRMLALRLGILE